MNFAHIRLPKFVDNVLMPDANGGLTMAFDIIKNDTIENSYLIISKAFCSTKDRFNRKRGRAIAQGRMNQFYKEISETNGDIADYLKNDYVSPTCIPLNLLAQMFNFNLIYFEQIDSTFPLREVIVHSFGPVFLGFHLGYHLDTVTVVRYGNVNLLLPNKPTFME